MSQTISVRNPRTGQVDYHFDKPQADELDAIVERLRAAQPGWAARSLDERIDVMKRFAEAIRQRQEVLASALSADTGRHRISQLESHGVSGWIEAWCQVAPTHLAPEPTQSAMDDSVSFDQQGVPYPLVGVISPWNYPLTLSMIDATPALLAGCAALVKPSEVTPRFVDPLKDAIASVPEIAEVLAFVQGDGDTGAAIIDRADAVCFTGSVATGKMVAAQAAPQFKKVFLELGGKDPAVVLSSADVDAAARAVVRGAVENTGQTCFSIERVYVDEAIYEPFVQRVVELSDNMELSYPNPDDGQVGPFIFDRQADIVAAQIEDAVAKGATIACGGQVEDLGGGKWLRPTVLTDVDHSMSVMQEETFGPVIPVMRFEGDDRGVELANDTRYGLSGIVFGADEEATQVARQINAGGMSVNGYALVMKVALQAEKHSFNESGAGGSRFGPDGIRRFLRRKMIAVNRATVEPISVLNEAQAS